MVLSYIMSSSSATWGLATLVLVYALFKHLTRPSLSMICGPKSPSFIFGHLLELFQGRVGESDFAWQNRYGNLIRIKSILGEDRLLVTDPKALRKILNGYIYQRLPNLRALEYMLNGEGIVWAEGEDHRRHKSMMLPGFTPNECRAFLPIFKDCAESVSTRWLETIASNDGQGVIINVIDWVSRGTLDAIGCAAFDIQFGAVQDDFHPLAREYKNYVDEVFVLPPAKELFMQAASKYVPMRILQWMAANGSNPRLVRLRDVKATVTRVAKELVRKKADTILQGKGNRDVFSLLVKANMDATANRKLSDEELYAQMRTLLIAGHETTASTLSWMLLELARNPDIQSKLRDEIRKTEATLNTRGDKQLTVTDLEGMPYLNAVIKEVLRLYPPQSHTLRVASQDDVLPLFKPILTKTGDMINEILVPKGTEVVISLAAYNRNEDLWGEDAHEFNPDRWLNGAIDERKPPRIGVYSSLLTFLSGTRACIGWRFAVIELQAFLSTLVGKFEFTLTDKSERITRQLLLLMAPMVNGEFERGAQMPLRVSLAPQDSGN